MKRNAIFYFIKECSTYTIEQYNYLRQTGIDVYIFIGDKNININRCIREFKENKDIYVFDVKKYKYDYVELEKIFDYNKFNIIKDYVNEHNNILNEYKYIYLIEPTIKYSKDINELFKQLNKANYDYISTYIEILTNTNVIWSWYNVFKKYFSENEYGKILKSYDGGFTRLSSISLQAFIKSNDNIFNYLFELSYPTMCYNNNYTIGSLSSTNNEDTKDFHFMNLCNNDTYYYNTNHVNINNKSFYDESKNILFNTYKYFDCINEKIIYKNENSDITIVMPIYNAEKTVKRTIESIINQNYFSNYELWCLNDGSTDNTLNILLEYENHPNIQIINLNHKGIVTTLNYAINNVTSKYIARMDADDIMLPERLLHQYNYMESHLECDILGSSIYINDDVDVYDMGTYEIKLKCLTEGNRIAHPATCFRTESIKKLPFLYEDYYEYCEDYKLWVTALLHGLRIFSESTPVIRYIVNNHLNDYRDTQEKNAIKIKNLVRQICNGISNENNNITAIISFRNEYEEIEKTVASLRATTNNMPIILLNDASDKDYNYKFVADKYHCKYFENETPSGCAGARNEAVKEVETDYFILLDGHMRTYENDWDKRALKIINEYGEDNIYFGTSIVITKNEYKQYTNEIGKLNNHTYGCILGGETYTLSPKWCYNKKSENFDNNDNVIPVPIMLGACYICSVKFWNKIHGLDGLLSWGQDETLLSLKTWLSGSQVLLIKDMLFGHIYRQKRPYKSNGVEMNSNHIYTNYLFSRTEEEYNDLNYIFEQCLGKQGYDKSYDCFMKRFDEAKQFKEYFYNNIAKRTMDWFWDFNYKADPKQVQEYYDKIKEILDKRTKEQS